MGDVHRAREEDAVQMGDGPGGPGHEPDLLRRITAPARERRRGVARPDVPPQERRRARVKQARATRWKPTVRRPAGRARPGPARASGGPAAAAAGDGSASASAGLGMASSRHRVRRHVHPTRHRRRAYCRGLCGHEVLRATVPMIDVVPDDRRCIVDRRRAARPLQPRGPWPAGAGTCSSSRRRGRRVTSAPAPRATRASSVSAIPSRTTSRWRSWPGPAGSDLEAATGRQLLHVTGQVTLGDETHMDAIAAALDGRRGARRASLGQQRRHGAFPASPSRARCSSSRTRACWPPTTACGRCTRPAASTLRTGTRVTSLHQIAGLRHRRDRRRT